MLNIENLTVKTHQKRILDELTLSVPAGQVCALIGPNGSGKSTLANVLAGHPAFEVVSGSITFLGQDLLALSPEERALRGLFLAFQHPVEIPGVNNLYFLKAALNSVRQSRGETELDAYDFLELVKAQLPLVGLEEGFLNRSLNSGFSGGEKKRNEILQLLLLKPRLAILDEMDSGLDVDALHRLSGVVNRLRSPDRSFLVITHYQRLLHDIQPEVVHVLSKGRIVKSGDLSLAVDIEQHGYQGLV